MTLFVRIATLGVALLGGLAGAHYGFSTPVVSHQAVSAKLPIPVCPPNDPNACGIK